MNPDENKIAEKEISKCLAEKLAMPPHVSWRLRKT